MFNFDNFDTLPVEVREAIELLNRLLTESEERRNSGRVHIHQKTDYLRAVYDQRLVGMSERKKKWYNERTWKKGICFHHSGVHKGAAAKRKRIEYYEKGGQPPGEFFEQFDITKMGTKAVQKALALGDRYRGQGQGEGWPYHAISAPNSVMYLNLPFDYWSWHGNQANREFLGFAWDGHSKKETWDSKDLQFDISRLMDLMVFEGHSCIEFTMHSCHANKPNDPGLDFLESVIMPVAQNRNVLIDLDRKSGHGHSIAEQYAIQKREIPKWLVQQQP